jgi:hypothetical protein
VSERLLVSSHTAVEIAHQFSQTPCFVLVVIHFLIPVVLHTNLKPDLLVQSSNLLRGGQGRAFLTSGLHRDMTI